MVEKIQIMTDSGSDIPKAYEKKHNIKILAFPISVGERGFFDRDMTDAEYYKLILDSVKAKDFPKTAQITIPRFVDAFEESFKSGFTDLIYTSIADLGSATFSNAHAARDEFYAEHPEASGVFRIHIIDSANYTGVYGWPVIQSAIRAEKGASAVDIIEYITDWCRYAEVNFGCYTLDFVKRSGRVSTAAAFVGEMLGLRPVIRIKQAVSTTPAKVRGDKAVVPKVVDITAERIIPGTPYIIIAGNDKAAEDDLSKSMTKRLGYPPEMVFYVGAAVGANVGPCVAGTIFKARPGL